MRSPVSPGGQNAHPLAWGVEAADLRADREPAKWIAKLRDRRTNNEPLLMYCNMDAGHGGASGRFEAYKETAMEYAFFLSLLEN